MFDGGSLGHEVAARLACGLVQALDVRSNGRSCIYDIGASFGFLNHLCWFITFLAVVDGLSIRLPFVWAALEEVLVRRRILWPLPFLPCGADAFCSVVARPCELIRLLFCALLLGLGWRMHSGPVQLVDLRLRAWRLLTRFISCWSWLAVDVHLGGLFHGLCISANLSKQVVDAVLRGIYLALCSA